MSERIITQGDLEAFATHLAAAERSRATIEKYLRDVRHFVEYAADAYIDRPLVLAYKEQLTSGFAVSSANSMLAALNTFFRWKGWPELCVRQFRVQRQVYRPEERDLTRAEYVRLVETARRRGDLRLELVLQTICATGIRVSELVQITLEAVKCGEAVVSCKGKTRKVFLVKALRKRLLNYAARRKIRSGPLFLGKQGKPLDRSSIWRQMKALCVQAGVLPDKVFPHNLRHVFARVFYGMEKDIVKLADILGHSSINTTRIYVMTSGVEHKRRMEAMHLIL